MEVPEVDVVELARQRAVGVTVLDVRQPHEYDEVHVPGALLIPLGEVAERSGEIPQGGIVYVICRSGARSRRAAEHLRGVGCDAVNVAGGMLAWVEAGHEVTSGSEPE